MSENFLTIISQKQLYNKTLESRKILGRYRHGE